MFGTYIHQAAFSTNEVTYTINKCLSNMCLNVHHLRFETKTVGKKHSATNRKHLEKISNELGEEVAAIIEVRINSTSY